MKTNTLRAKLLNCFFAFTLVFGLCIPSIGSYAYAEPPAETPAGDVAVHVEGAPSGEDQTNNVGNNSTGDTGNTNNLGDGVQDKNTTNTDTNANNSNSTETEVATTQAEEVVPLAADATAGSMTISGGTSGVDYRISANEDLVEVLTSTPLTLTGSFSGSVQVNAGVDAYITFNDVNISNAWPFNIKAGGTAHIVLADGSHNSLSVTSGNYQSPGLHCGTGATVYIDDAVPNVDTSGNPIIPENGMIPAGITYVDQNGTTRTSERDRITLLDSLDPGSLSVTGGGQGAGFGGTYSEDGGNMTFNGGNITVYNGAGPTSGGNGENCFGPGIGGGGNAAGTSPGEWITINGGNVIATAAYHGAGIGGGWNQDTRTVASGVVKSTHPSGTGNIRINGGYVESNGGNDGNGFGRGCYGQQHVCKNSDYTIIITGGTMIPKGGTNLGQYSMDIGGSGTGTSSDPKADPATAANVIITGGSVYVGTDDDGKFRFDGKAYGSYTMQDGKYVPNKNDEVNLITIDLAADLLGGNTVPTEENRKGLNNNVNSWNLRIGGTDTTYGAPARFDRGQLYLWLPAEALETTVAVRFSYVDGKNEDGSDIIKTPDELYREKDAGSVLKQYVKFEIPENFFTEGEKQQSTLPDGLLNNVPDMYKPVGGGETVNLISKPYDGLSFGVTRLEDMTDDNRVMTSDNKPLTDSSAVVYNYQVYDPATNKLGPEQSSEHAMPSNAGLMAFVMVSKEYADPNSTDDVKKAFAEAYWGHRATGWCQIHEVPAVVNLYSAEWGTLTKDENNEWKWKETKENDPEPGNRIKLHFDIRSALGTAVTCSVPTGSFQVLVDDKEVGNPIPLTDEAIKAEDNNKLTKYDSKFKDQRAANTEKNNTDRALLGDRAKADVVYYLDPTRIDGLLDVLESEATPEIQSEIQAMAESSGDIEGVNKNSHKVTIKYLPDINYFEGTEEGYEEAATKPTTIIPVKNEPDVKDDKGNKINFNDKFETSLVKNYSDFHKRNTDGTPVEGIDPYFKLAIKSKSASPVTWTTSDPAVADIMRYTEDDPKGAYKAGDVIYEESQDGELIPRIEVKSCGYTTITMSQGSNAFFNGQKRTIHLTVIPDATIVPTTEVRVVWENATNPGYPAAPGDVLEYTVIGSNLTEGSSWQEVVLGDEFDKDLEFVPNSVQIAKNFTSPENLDALTPESFKGVKFEDLASNKYNVANNTITLNKDIVNSIYGGQSSAFKFQVKVKDNLTDRKAVTGENPPKIPNTPTVDGGSGIVETADLVPGQDRGKYQNLKDGDNPTKVYSIESDEIPEAVVIPKDPKLPGEPSGDNRSDISVVKTAKNLTHPEGNKALVGDTIEYSITVENKGKDSCYYWPVIKDTLPAGLAPVAGSFELTKVDGSKVSVPDSAYQKATNTISLYVDDLYGNEKTTLTFKCTVTPEATDIANTAQVIGTTPSDKWKGEHPDPIVDPADDPKLSYIKFDANEGQGAPEGIKGETSSAITTAFPTTEPTREGYEFVGWNTQIDGTGLGIKAYPSKFLSNPGSIYYYAQWKKVTTDDPGKEPGDPKPVDPTQYSYILFAANGGKNAPEGIQGEPESAVTDKFPTAEPTAPEGYEFVGWFDDRDAGNKVEKYPDTFPAVTDADNNVKPITTYYYAHWQKIDNPSDPSKPDIKDGDPDPVDPLGLAYIKFDANGGQFVTPVVAQADTATAPVWSTAGLSGTPNTAIADADKNTFPLKEYGPVVRKGYTFDGWYDDPVAGNEITAYGNTFAANPGTTYYYAHWVKDPEPTWPPAPGQPFSPDPNIPADEYPWDDPDHPFNWDEYLGDDPKIETPEPADVGKVMPADPDYKDLRITLSAKNEARTDGNTYVGDEVTYTILIENLSSPEKSWLDVIARADIPEGLKFMPGSIYLTTPTGEVIHVDDAAYNDLTRILALNVGDLAGGETAKVVFKAEVTIDALNKDIGMTSKAYGTLPSEFDVEDESYVKPEPGSAFVPAEGWNLYDLNHKSISNPEKVYPSENVTEQQHVLGTPDQQEQAKKLAKTGDTLGFIALGVGVIAAAAVITLLVALRRIRRDK